MTQRWTFSFEFMSNKEVTRWTVEASLCKSGCLNSKAVQLINNTEKLFSIECFFEMFFLHLAFRIFSAKVMNAAFFLPKPCWLLQEPSKHLQKRKIQRKRFQATAHSQIHEWSMSYQLVIPLQSSSRQRCANVMAKTPWGCWTFKSPYASVFGGFPSQAHSKHS